jgi:hypothetical protein
MQQKAPFIALFFSFFLGYLSWADQSRFIFQLEYELFFTLGNKGENFAHPLILLPFLGQIMVLWHIFQPSSRKIWFWLGTGMMGLLMALLALIGILDAPLVGLSTAPFWASVIWCWRRMRTV